MGPIRTEKRSHHSQHASTSSNTQQSRSKAKGKSQSHKTKTDSDPNALPGVQKIKSSIRQARRLLSRDKLDADVRQQTERKLKALEADLAKAEENRKEKTLATKYHMAKFFERQKVVRKIKQTTRNLSKSEGKEKERLESDLFNLRVDLNYVLNYPKSKKYISLFPPEVRQGEKEQPSTSASTNAEREEVKRWIREQMEKGTITAEPEKLKEVVEGKTSKKTSKAKPDVKWTKANKQMPSNGQNDVEDDEAGDDEAMKDDFFEDDDGSSSSDEDS